MSPKVQQIFEQVREQVRELSNEERSLLGELIHSFDDDEPDDDEPDDLDDEDRARLHESIDRSLEEIERGEDVPAEQVFAELGIPIRW